SAGAAAFLGRRLELSDGAVVGHLFALDDKAHETDPADADLVSLVARAASIELHRQQAVEALTLSEKRFRDIAEISTDWIWETDEQHRYTYFSSRFSTVTGLEAEQALGLTRQELAGVDSSDPAWRAHLADIEAHRDIREFTYRGQL